MRNETGIHSHSRKYHHLVFWLLLPLVPRICLKIFNLKRIKLRWAVDLAVMSKHLLTIEFVVRCANKNHFYHYFQSRRMDEFPFVKKIGFRDWGCDLTDETYEMVVDCATFHICILIETCTKDLNSVRKIDSDSLNDEFTTIDKRTVLFFLFKYKTEVEQMHKHRPNETPTIHALTNRII